MAIAIAPALIAIGVEAATASVVASVSAIAIGVGVSLLGTLLTSRAKQPKPSDGQVVINDSTAPRFRSYGQVKVAGNRMFANTIDGFYGQIFAMGSGEIDSIVEHWIDDNLVTLDGGGYVVETDYIREGVSRVHIDVRLGDDSPAVYTITNTSFPSLWTTDHLGKGIPSAEVILQQTKDSDFADVFPRAGDTLYRQVQKGAKVRGIVDGAFTTAAWSDNAALIIADYLTHPDGLGLDDSWILNEADLWEQAVADCDDPIDLKAGGTEARYRIWNTYYFNERPADVLARFLQACDAFLYPTPNRGLGIKVGKWEEPTVLIDDTSISGFSGLGRGRDILTTANTIRAQWTNAENDYQEDDAQPWVDAADVAARGEISADLEFFSAPSHSQCRRLMKIAAHRANPNWVGTLTCNCRGLAALGERVIGVQIAELGVADTFEIVGSKLIIEEGTVLTGVELNVQSFGSEAYAWVAEDEEGEPPG